MNDNVINAFGTPADPKPATLGLWEVFTRQPDGAPEVDTVFGDMRMSPISLAFYDFDDKMDAFYMLNDVVKVLRVADLTAEEAAALDD